MMTSMTESIGDLVGPLVAAAGLELWDVTHGPGVVRVLVDRLGGVDLDTIGEVAKTISAELDLHEDLVPGSGYQLEVSSPGVERTLRTPSHYERFVGSLLSVKTKEAIDGSRRFRGVLLAADEAGITLGPEADGADPADGTGFAYHQIQKAHTVLVWGAAPKPGSPRSRPRAASVPGPAIPTHPPVSMKDIAT